ncbi:MAG: hypothetical protein LBP87_15100, partial [Planctomycetaceae bacterium]|nr:hypothetical protein [Planctomycetaceae bacterium]
MRLKKETVTVVFVDSGSSANEIIAKTFTIPHCETLHYQLFTLNYCMLPFQGVDGLGRYPPRCGGLACVAPSGRRKQHKLPLL